MWMGTVCKAKDPDTANKPSILSRVGSAVADAAAAVGAAGSSAMSAAGKSGSDAVNAVGVSGTSATNAAGEAGMGSDNAAGNTANAAGNAGANDMNAAPGAAGTFASSAAGEAGTSTTIAGAAAHAVSSPTANSKNGKDPVDPPPEPFDNPAPPLPPTPMEGDKSGSESTSFKDPTEEAAEGGVAGADEPMGQEGEAPAAEPAPDKGCSKHTSCNDCCEHDDRCVYSKSNGVCSKRLEDALGDPAATNGKAENPDDWCAKACLPDVEPEPPALPEPPVYPIPWCSYADLIPKDLDWLPIAADDGMTIQTNGRPAVIGTLGKDTMIVSYKDGDMENARITYAEAKTQMEQPEVFKVAKDVDPRDFSSHYLEAAPPAVKEDFPTGDKKADKNKADKLESQLEAFAWDKSKASPECISNDAKVQADCMTNPLCRCEDPLLWLRLVKGEPLTSAEHPDKPLCLTTSRASEKKKFGELEFADCSDKSLWVARRTIDDGHWGRMSPIGKPNSKVGEPLSANAGIMGKFPYVNNYQLVSLGDSRGSNEAGSIFDSMREPARCLDRKAPRRQNSQVRAIIAASEFTCVHNRDPPPAPTGDPEVDAAAKNIYQAAMKDSNDEKCARTQQGGMFWDMKKDDAKEACEAFPSSVQELKAWRDNGGTESEEPPTGGCMFVESAPQKDDFACSGDGKKGTCNYCNSAGSQRWDIKKNGLICEDACRNCLSASNLGKSNTLDHCFSDDSKSKHETDEQMGLFEVVDFAVWEKNHPFREDPFESLAPDMANMREAARRGISRHLMGSTAVQWYEKIGEAASDNWPDFTADEGSAELGADLNDMLKKFIEFFTATRTKFAGYESITSVRRYETSRKEIGNRFAMAGVPPKSHPWCPSMCNDILTSESTAPSLEAGFPVETEDYNRILEFSTNDIVDLSEDAEKEKKEELAELKKAGDVEEDNEDDAGNEDGEGEFDESSDEYYQKMLESVILMSQLAAGNEYPQITGLKADLEAASPPENEETAALVTEIIEMLSVYTEPESLEASNKHPTTWAYATCFLADCYSGVGDERAIIQAKVRSADQYKDSTELSVNVRDAILDGEIKTMGYKSMMKICELRYDRNPKWWARAPGETPKSFLQVSMRSKEHIEALVSAHKENVLEALPSLQRLGPEALKTACANNAMVKNGKAELEACENLKQAYFCRENGAIIDMVHKEQCKEENKAFCTFQQSMIMPCLYEDCLGPAEKAAVPTKCMESNTAYGDDKEWVCGYRKVGTDDDSDGKCDCGEMRALQASMVGRLFLGLADWARKNAWLIATVALLIVGTGICLAFPSCMAMMGVQSNVPADAFGNMANAGSSLGCAGPDLDKLMSMNPGVSMPAGGPWHISSVTKVSGSGFGAIFGAMAVVKNVGAVATRKYLMIPTPFSMVSGLNAQALQMDKAVNVFGDSKQGMPFRTDYIKPNSVLTIPPGCSGFGAGVDYKRAGPMVFGKLLGGVMAANKMFKAVKSFLNWYKNLGIKSYDKEFKADTLFESGVPITLRRDDVDPSVKHKCLGVKTSGSVVYHANFMECSRQDVIWRSEIKQRDTEETYTKRLYRVARFSATSGIQHQNYASEFTVALGVAHGYGPGRCLRWDDQAKGFSAQGCSDRLPVTDTDYVLKSNGMICVNECKDCLVIDKETKKLSLEHCGEPEEKKTKAGATLNGIKRLMGGGDYKLKDNIVYFKAEPLRGSSTTSTGGKLFDTSPSPLAWRVCNWFNGDGSAGSADGGQLDTYINDEWPLSKRADICNAVGPNCGVDAADGMCKPVVLDGTEVGMPANLAQQSGARAEMGQQKMEFGAKSDPNSLGNKAESEAAKFRSLRSDAEINPELATEAVPDATPPEMDKQELVQQEHESAPEAEIESELSSIENAMGNDMARERVVEEGDGGFDDFPQQ
jgi:hypothetical protein